MSNHDDSDSNRLNELNGKEWVKSTKSWFIINPRSRNTKQVEHPGKFPEELVERFVQFFTHRENWVLDPFGGVGSAALACKSLGRNSVSIELVPKFATIAREQIREHEGSGRHEVITGDSKRGVSLIEERFDGKPPEFDYLITSPPYWNMLRKSRGGNITTHKERREEGLSEYYSESNRDIGNIESYDAYLQSVTEILEGYYGLLKNGAYLTVVAQNMRDIDGDLKAIAWDLARLLSETYDLKQEQIWCQDNKRLG
ncbi:MAG: DNA methyltransferase, partial [Promethearchaeati archaeon]